LQFYYVLHEVLFPPPYILAKVCLPSLGHAGDFMVGELGGVQDVGGVTGSRRMHCRMHIHDLCRCTLASSHACVLTTLFGMGYAGAELRNTNDTVTTMAAATIMKITRLTSFSSLLYLAQTLADRYISVKRRDLVDPSSLRTTRTRSPTLMVLALISNLLLACFKTA